MHRPCELSSYHLLLISLLAPYISLPTPCQHHTNTILTPCQHCTNSSSSNWSAEYVPVARTIAISTRANPTGSTGGNTGSSRGGSSRGDSRGDRRGVNSAGGGCLWGSPMGSPRLSPGRSPVNSRPSKQPSQSTQPTQQQRLNSVVPEFDFMAAHFDDPGMLQLVSELVLS